MRASDKMDSCKIRAALQILQSNTRAPQNIQTAAEVHSLVAVETDAHEIVRIKTQFAAIKQVAAKFSRETDGQGVLCWRVNRAPAAGGMLTWRLLEELKGEKLDAPRVGQLCCEDGWAPGLRQQSHTVRRSFGRRPRLPHETADRRNLNLVNICRSLAHASFAPSLWQRS